MSRIDIETRFDWDTFARRYWNKRPVLFKGTGAVPFEPRGVFEAALGAVRAPERRADVLFTLDRLHQLVPEPWLPRASDGSLDAYDARIAGRLEGRRYALTISYLHASGPRLWFQERIFFSELWRRVGIPLTSAITTLFHGNYEHTPTGVHLDRFTTFLFALKGRKRMRFWREKPWTAPVSTLLDYQPYLKTSFVAEVEPGDLLYWPSSYYHVGESAGPGVASSVNVGIPISEHRMLYSVEDVLHGAFSTPVSVEASPLVPGALGAGGVLSPELPRPLREAVQVFREAGRRQGARGNLRATWLNHLSATGIDYPVPAPARPRRLKDEDCVRVDPRLPILMEKEGAGRWLCSANGHALRVTGDVKAAARMVQALNSGRELRVGELLRPWRTASSRERMRSVLEKLQAFRALERVPRTRRVRETR